MNDHARPARAELGALLRKAEDGAGFAMRKIGRVPPTFLAAPPSGLLTFIPSTMADERAKDTLANTARLPAPEAASFDRCLQLLLSVGIPYGPNCTL